MTYGGAWRSFLGSHAWGGLSPLPVPWEGLGLLPHPPRGLPVTVTLQWFLVEVPPRVSSTGSWWSLSCVLSRLISSWLQGSPLLQPSPRPSVLSQVFGTFRACPINLPPTRHYKVPVPKRGRTHVSGRHNPRFAQVPSRCLATSSHSGLFP